MPTPPRRRIIAAALSVTALAAGAAIAVSDPGGGTFTGIPTAQPKQAGTPVPNVIAPGYVTDTVADGSYPLENPGTVTGSAPLGIAAPASPIAIDRYGLYGDGPMLAATGTLGTLSEPDKNTYLVFPKGTIRGADPTYEYGRRFLYQGHEAGPGSAGYLTRINLDADQAHRVTLLASADKAGNQLPAIDGSIWNPFSQTLLFSGEEGNTIGGIWQATANLPSTVTDMVGVFGRGSYEGISVDSAGNVWLVEDAGGASPSSASPLDNARVANSFVYRLVPTDRTDLGRGGRLQVLQVSSRATGNPAITFASCPAPATDACLEGQVTSQDLKDLHTTGLTFATRWVTIHDTAVDGTASFDPNALAKAKGGTPFKRPENGAFRPGTSFKEFFFTETGDTNADKGSGAASGQYGGIYRLTQTGPAADTGTLAVTYVGDTAHTGFDNLNFLSRNQLMVVEDAGDTLHTQRKATDSAYLIDVTASPPKAVRFIAQGRDPVATFRNADDEITGITASNGDPTAKGMLGAVTPAPFRQGSGWRVFFTNQHGMNVTQELVRQPARGD